MSLAEVIGWFFLLDVTLVCTFGVLLKEDTDPRLLELIVLLHEQGLPALLVFFLFKVLIS